MEEERSIREIEKSLAVGEVKTRQMLEFINKFEGPVNAKEEEKNIIKKMINDIEMEIDLYKGYNQKNEDIKKKVNNHLANNNMAV